LQHLPGDQRKAGLVGRPRIAQADAQCEQAQSRHEQQRERRMSRIAKKRRTQGESWGGSAHRTTIIVQADGLDTDRKDHRMLASDNMTSTGNGRARIDAPGRRLS
jgi:hypothetical protein